MKKRFSVIPIYKKAGFNVNDVEQILLVKGLFRKAIKSEYK